MNDELGLSLNYINKHPEEAVKVVEQLSPPQISALINILPLQNLHELIQCMTPYSASQCIKLLSLDKQINILERLPMQTVSMILGSYPKEIRGPILNKLPDGYAKLIEQQLGYPENTIGALMDINFIALPDQTTVEQAVQQIKETQIPVIDYLYIVGDKQILKGSVHITDLLRASGALFVNQIMKKNIKALSDLTSIFNISSNPTWKSKHTMPVVNKDNRLLGVFYYSQWLKFKQELNETLTSDIVNLFDESSHIFLSSVLHIFDLSVKSLTFVKKK